MIALTYFVPQIMLSLIGFHQLYFGSMPDAFGIFAAQAILCCYWEYSK